MIWSARLPLVLIILKDVPSTLRSFLRPWEVSIEFSRDAHI